MKQYLQGYTPWNPAIIPKLDYGVPFEEYDLEGEMTYCSVIYQMEKHQFPLRELWNNSVKVILPPWKNKLSGTFRRP